VASTCVNVFQGLVRKANSGEIELDSTLIQAGLASAETMVNQALEYDPGSQQKMAKLAPKVLAIEITKPEFNLYIRFTDDGIHLMSHYEQEPDAALSGELSAFINVATGKDKHAALMQSDLQIRGSSQLALSLADLMNDLSIDWEAMIAKFAGPVAAHIIGKQARGLFGWLKKTGEKFQDDVISYVRDERQMAAHELEGEDRFRQIHQLRLDTERLEARIQKLAAKLSK
jgi:ubiquinone biosynthesis protein UbiJ